MKYLFCYDISNPKRLIKIAKVAESMGHRIQKSIFSLDLNIKEYEELMLAVTAIFDPSEDRIAVYKICERCASSGYYLGCDIMEFFRSNYIIL